MNHPGDPIPIRPKPPRPPVPDRVAYWIAIGFGSGKLPKAPGSWGSALALVIGWWLLESAGLRALNALATLAFLLGLWASHRHARLTGRRDAGEVVIDEFVGQWITIMPLAMTTIAPERWMDFALAFFLFRLFDIWKPWPIGLIDRRMKSAFGVMLDDVVAGIMAGIVLALLGRVL